MHYIIFFHLVKIFQVQILFELIFGIKMNPNEYLIYVSEYKVLICRSCEYCLQPGGLYRHFQSEHKEVPINIRKALVEYADSLNVVKPMDVRYPIQQINVIPGLK